MGVKSDRAQLDSRTGLDARPRGALLIGPGEDAATNLFSLHRFLDRFRPDSPTTVPFDPLVTCVDTLAETLPEDWQVFWAVRRGRPSIARVVQRIAASGVRDLVVLPMQPEYTAAATGGIMRELYRALSRTAHFNLTACTTWNDDAGYVNAQARLIAEYAATQSLTPQNTRLTFAAIPWNGSTLSERTAYEERVRYTAQLVSARVGWPAAGVDVVFGRKPWAIEWPRGEGEDENLLVCSLDVLNGGVASVVPFETAGVRVYVCPVLTTHEPFVAALKNLILRGSRPVVPGSTPVKPLLVPNLSAGEVQRELESLVMVGASLPGKVRSRRGPYVMHSDSRLFCSVKKSRHQLRGFLDWARDQERIAEGFVWNTCQRVEFYGWLADPDNLVEREYVVAQARQRLFGARAAELKVNVLFGSDAWHHVMRTVSGLNSELPGDTDLVTQLETSCRVAERAGTAGLRAPRLVESAVKLAGDLRAKTSWGRFSAGYCLAALSRICDADGAPLNEKRFVVIGGSATSRSILATLSESFQVPQRQMTLVYRDHHGQMKLLRQALGHGKRLRVHSYRDPRVLEAIACADFVCFGIDQAEPVLDLDKLGGLRDFAARSLAILDFNSFGSTNGERTPRGVTVWTAEDLEGAVAAYATAMCGNERFTHAVSEAEDWIERRLPGGGKDSPEASRADEQRVRGTKDEAREQARIER